MSQFVQAAFDVLSLPEANGGLTDAEKILSAKELLRAELTPAVATVESAPAEQPAVPEETPAPVAAPTEAPAAAPQA